MSSSLIDSESVRHVLANVAQLAKCIYDIFLDPVFMAKVTKLKEREATGMKTIDPGTNWCFLETVQKANWQDIYVFQGVKVADQLVMI